MTDVTRTAGEVHTTTLGPGLIAIHGVVDLGDGLGSYPPGEPGYVSINQYLVVGAGHAVLVDTGMSIHEQGLIAALERHLPVGTVLSVLPLRQGELDSVCNVRPLHERFGLHTMFGAQPDGPSWVDFRPEWSGYGQPTGAHTLAGMRFHCLAAQDVVPVGPDRELAAFRPLFRLLPTHWLYDEVTRTLFTSDAFTHCLGASRSGPWVTREAISPTDLRRRWAGGRFWWLDGARTEQLRADLERVFTTYPVERIAPASGCVIDGRDAVSQHYQLVQDELRALEGESR